MSTTKKSANLKSPAIVTLRGNWNLFGDIEYRDNGDVVIHEAHTLHRWGTTHGLGEIACKGYTSNTIAEFVGTVDAPRHAILHVITAGLKQAFPSGNKEISLVSPEGFKKQIVTIAEAWNMIGHVETLPNGDIRMHNAATLHRWGTTHGLGELACKGYQPETQAKFVGEVYIPCPALLHRIHCIV